ncbi:uncharacterized protein LOC144598543 [Rhinoraja longicauda]
MSQCPKGGAVIHHKVVDGKHRYRIGEVLQTKRARFPFRSGDQLLQVNGENVLTFPPEILAERLRERSTLLTLHSPNIKTEPAEPGEDVGPVYRPYNKQETQLHFSLAMVQMNDGCAVHNNDATIKGKDGTCPAPETPSTPVNSPQPSSVGEENGGVVCDEDEARVLLVALNHFAVSDVRARGPHCSSGILCPVCKEKECEINTVNVSTESESDVYYLKEEASPNECCEMIMKVMYSDCPFLIHNERDQYLRPGNYHRRIVLSRQNSESAQMTIFYYKSNKIPNPYCGLPVVLKFSKTNCFLMCHSEESNILLRIEGCTSDSLKRIPEGSPKWRFIFYMKEQQDGTLSFESAQYPGWFINNLWNQKRAEMKRTVEETLNADFIFILLKV